MASDSRFPEELQDNLIDRLSFLSLHDVALVLVHFEEAVYDNGWAVVLVGGGGDNG